jgi:hypothetical protein
MTGVRIAFRVSSYHCRLVARYVTCYPQPRTEPPRFPICRHTRTGQHAENRFRQDHRLK